MTTIEVAVRVRPVQLHEWGQKSTSSSPTSHDIPDSVKSFRYPSTVVVGSNQTTCFEAIGAPLLARMSQGYNTTLLAYGQTGSGKTFTVFGPTGSLTETSLEEANGAVPREWGIFPRIAHAMVSDSRNLKFIKMHHLIFSTIVRLSKSPEHAMQPKQDQSE